WYLPHRRSESRHAGVVADDVDAAEPVERRFRECVELILEANVGHHADRRRAVCLDALDRLREAIGFHIREHPTEAAGGACLGEREAESARGAGDDGYLSGFQLHASSPSRVCGSAQLAISCKAASPCELLAILSVTRALARGLL